MSDHDPTMEQRPSVRMMPFEPTDDEVVTAGLVVRAGFGDERLATRGIAELVAHLLLTAVPPDLGRRRTHVDQHTTNFVIHGTRATAEEFLHTLAAAVVDPPYERIDTVARVLRTRTPAPRDPLLAISALTRCGPTGYGLAACREFHLEQPDAAVVFEWLRDHYTVENTAPWSDHHDLERPTLRLPRGPRRSPPPITSGPDRLPAAVSRHGAPIGVAVTGPTSPQLLVGMVALREQVADTLRVGEVDHDDVRLVVEHLDGTSVTHCGVAVDAPREHADAVRAAIVAGIALVCTEGPDDATVARAATALARRARRAEPHEAFDAMARARAGLFGEPPASVDDTVIEYELVRPDEAAAALRNASARAVWVSPPGIEWPDGLATPVRRWSERAVQGAVMTPHQRGTTSDTRRLTMSAEGITMTYGDEAERSTVRYDRVALMVVERNGDRTVVGDDGFGCTIHADLWPWFDVIIRHLDRHVPAERILWRGERPVVDRLGDRRPVRADPESLRLIPG